MKNNHDVDVLLICAGEPDMDDILVEISYNSCQLYDIWHLQRLSFDEIAKYDEVVFEIKSEFLSTDEHLLHLISTIWTISMYRGFSDAVLIYHDLDVNLPSNTNKLLDSFWTEIDKLTQIKKFDTIIICNMLYDQEDKILKYLSTKCRPSVEFVGYYTDNSRWVEKYLMPINISKYKITEHQEIFQSKIDDTKNTLMEKFSHIAYDVYETEESCADTNNLVEASFSDNNSVMITNSGIISNLAAFEVIKYNPHDKIIVYLWFCPSGDISMDEAISQCDRFFIDLSVSAIASTWKDHEDIEYFSSRKDKHSIQNVLYNAVELDLVHMNINLDARYPSFSINGDNEE